MEDLAFPPNLSQISLAQISQTKAVDNGTKVFVYRNMVKALPWYKSVRGKIVALLTLVSSVSYYYYSSIVSYK